MPSRLTTIAVASALGISALSATVAVPALADTVTGRSSASDAVGERVRSIRDALQGLVDDKTITDAQADKVADRLGRSDAFRGPGGPGRHGLRLGGQEGIDAVAKVLGMSPDAVRSALREGTTLGELAEKQGKSSDDVVAALVTAAKARLAEAVKAGRITQERADRLSSSIEPRIREFVENGKPGRGEGHRRGWWREHGDAPDERRAPGDPSPSDPSPTVTGSAFLTT